MIHIKKILKKKTFVVFLVTQALHSALDHGRGVEVM